MLLHPAGLRRSFRLSRKDRQGSSGDANALDSSDQDFLTYEEVTRYQHRPHERPRLVVLIGKWPLSEGGIDLHGGADLWWLSQELSTI